MTRSELVEILKGSKISKVIVSAISDYSAIPDVEVLIHTQYIESSDVIN